MIKTATVLLMMLIASITPKTANSLTMSEFVSICEKMQTKCHENQFLQAYVGGALDLLAALDEETNYLAKIVCKDKRSLFNTDAIIRYMMENQKPYKNRNATLVIVRYMEENGGCSAHSAE